MFYFVFPKEYYYIGRAYFYYILKLTPLLGVAYKNGHSWAEEMDRSFV